MSGGRMAATMAVMRAASETALITCECGQVLGSRTHNALALYGAELRLDSKGRPVIVCPVPTCQRFTEVRRVMHNEHSEGNEP